MTNEEEALMSRTTGLRPECAMRLQHPVFSIRHEGFVIRHSLLFRLIQAPLS